jgi:hypothetical protein
MLTELSGQVYILAAPYTGQSSYSGSSTCHMINLEAFRACLPGRKMPMRKCDVVVKMYRVVVMKE